AGAGERQQFVRSELRAGWQHRACDLERLWKTQRTPRVLPRPVLAGVLILRADSREEETMRRLVIAIAAWSAWATLAASFGVSAQTACLAATPAGAAQGLDRGGSCAFLGIPYALPPTGNRRWAAPQPAPPWAPSVLDATIAPPNCPQLNVANGVPLG